MSLPSSSVSPEWSNSSNGPPPPNPILSAYEGFVRDTPLVTRYVLTTLFATWFLSFFINPHFALSNIPYYTLYHFEIYRIILSPFLCSSLLSLVFAYMSFNSSGKRLEFSMGSTAFAWLLFTIGAATNVAFIVLCVTLNVITNEAGWIHRSSSGIWTILFGVITIECVAASTASEGSLRHYQIFSVQIPTLYYPLVIFAIFSLLGGFSFADLLSVIIGYAYAYGYLDRLKISNARFKEWEDSYLAGFTRREGWVVGHAATGSNAWNEGSTLGGGFGMFPSASQRTATGVEATRLSGITTESRDVALGGTATSETPAVSFPASGGRALGAAQRRAGSADARVARLEKLEKRPKNEKDGTSDGEV